MTTTKCSNLSPYEKQSETPYNIANFEAIMIPWGGAPLANITGPSAIECALWMCVQAYNVSVNLGRASQAIVHTWVDWKVANTTPWDSIEFTGMPKEFNVADNSSFQVSTAALYSIKNAFNFSGNIRANYDLEPMYSGDTSQSMGVAAAVGNWESWIQKVARSIGNDIRTNSRQPIITEPYVIGDEVISDPPPNPYYDGSAYITRPFIQVRWWWLTYPAAMIVASLVYLLLTMWQCRHHGAYIWKDHPLVLLSVALDHSIAEKAKGSLTRLGDLDQRIGDEKVVLEYDWGIWRLQRDQMSAPWPSISLPPLEESLRPALNPHGSI
ncbi:hypothetical protein DV736_g2290, partial [Chaetothyriales sp. CBS 134916]